LRTQKISNLGMISNASCLLAFLAVLPRSGPGGQSAYRKSVEKFSSARFQSSASAGRVFPERDTVFFRQLFVGIRLP
jgi:hypothetical protein